MPLTADSSLFVGVTAKGWQLATARTVHDNDSRV